MLIKSEEIGEIEVRPGMFVYGEDLNGEARAVIVDEEDLEAHQIEAIERLMEDIRKPAVVLRDFILSLR